MRYLLISASVFCLVPAAASADAAADLMAPYLRIQTALANDALATVKADAGLIEAEAARIGEGGQALRTAAAEVAEAPNLNAARAAFGRLSDAMVKYADSERVSLGGDLNVAYCSMVKKSWIQKGSAIVNPYGGKQMQNCGEIVKPVK